MKKILIIILMILFIINVNASELPIVVEHKVMVTNKDGAICYKDGKKDGKPIPYKTMLMVKYDISGSYINVTNDEYDCDVKYSDVSANTQQFSIDNKNVEKISNIRALVLPTTGLNMRIGPSVTYAKMMTIPQNTILTLTHKAGTYWYYTEYNGKLGWVTAMNKYIGFDSSKVLVNYEKTKLYDTNGKAIISTIPENTKISNYIKLDTIKEDDFKYYVIYNGTKGYIKDMLYSVDSIGKIKLTKDYDILDSNGTKIKKMTSGQELEYNMVNENGDFYIPEKNLVVHLDEDAFEYITKAKVSIKSSGYIGEGLFGENKETVVTPTPEIEPVKEDKKEQGISVKDIIIICLLSGIFIALLAIVVIKIVNNKKSIAS